MTRGMAVPTTVWSRALSSMPSMTLMSTKATRRRLRVSPQGAATGTAAEDGPPAEAARPAGATSVDGRSIGAHMARPSLYDGRQGVQALGERPKVVPLHEGEPPGQLFPPAAAQALHQQVSLFGSHDEGPAPVGRIGLPHHEAAGHELVHQQARRRFGYAERPGQPADGELAVS